MSRDYNQGIQFERPIGAPADVRELEYVSALHQTNEEEIRMDGTIRAKDIRNYLTSRHGIFVEADTILERIILDLCGSASSDNSKKNRAKGEDQPAMDICQMVALLLIPYLRQEDEQEAKKPANSLVRGMAEQVLKLILDELGHSGVDLKQFKAVDENFETGTRITPKLIQHMFDAYGEYSVPDDILEEMVEAAAPSDAVADDDELQDSSPILLKTRPKGGDTGTKVFWTKTSFQRALTADVQLYKPDWEEDQTTHLQDTQQSAAPSPPINMRGTRGRQPESPAGDRVTMEDDFFTAPTIDQSADQYRSVTWTLLLWISFLFFYGCYMFDSAFSVSFDSCNNFSWGCDAGAAIVNWLVVFAQLGIVGTLYIFLGSLGNSTPQVEDLLGSDKAIQAMGVFVGIGVVVCGTIVPNFVEGEAFIWNSIKVEGFEAMYWICFCLGIVLVCLQLIRIVDIFASLGSLGIGGRTRSEQCTKQAATKKVNTMVENAMMLHVAPILAGQKPKAGAQPRYAVKHASPVVVKLAEQLHEEHDQIFDTTKGKVPSRVGGEGRGSGRALFNYGEMNNTTETTGGVLWAYQRMADGSMYDEEGIWFSARLITSAVAQFLVVAMLIVVYFVILGEFKDNKSNSVAVGSRRLMEDALVLEHPSIWQTGAVETHTDEVFRGQAYRDHRRVHPANRQRRLQSIAPVNETHYTDGTGIYPNIIDDLNRTHFTDGTTVWPYSIFSHNGTHVFDKYFRYNTTHFTDGVRFYAYSQYATNGTHITNGEYLFDGISITELSGNPAVNNIEQWEFEVALALGLVVAVIATAGITVVYIPSFVSTVLKFRSGVFESLKGEKHFKKLRDAPDRVTTLLGSAIWGAAFTGLFCWVFVGGIIFVSIWSQTRDIALQIYALLVGLLVVFLLRSLVSLVCRDLYVSSFYRKHPAAINFINLLLECWNLALSVGTMLARALKHSIIAFYYIGRIDVPTFAPGVGTVGPLHLDSEHMSFKNELLIHESHRHPFLERIGMMYLMKLHNGSEFGSRAGAYWRMLFVLALMPWMRKYRVSNRHKNGDGSDDESATSVEDFEDELASQGGGGSVMSLHGMDIELELTRRANEQLTERNGALKDALVDLRQRLRSANKKVAKLEKKAGTAARSSILGDTGMPGPRSVTQPQSVKEPSFQGDGESSFESESELQPASEDSFSSESGSGLV